MDRKSDKRNPHREDEDMMKRLAAIVVLGALAFGCQSMRMRDTDSDTRLDGPNLYTCPMHPDVRMPAATECPICSMDLIPVVESR